MPTDASDIRKRAKDRARRSLATMTDEEDDKLSAAAAVDSENPPLDDQFWARAKPLESDRLRRMPKSRRDTKQLEPGE